MNPIDWLIVNVHQFLGHHKAAAFLGVLHLETAQ